jgi:hypothetical protein
MRGLGQLHSFRKIDAHPYRASAAPLDQRHFAAVTRLLFGSGIKARDVSLARICRERWLAPLVGKASAKRER